ncbi:MAG: hypothetical protein AAFQ42_11600 [Pseudomonadota bacterium]
MTTPLHPTDLRLAPAIAQPTASEGDNKSLTSDEPDGANPSMTRKSPRRFHVWGERCSGTHFIIKLLERNLLDAEYSEAHGHKHWVPRPGDTFAENDAGIIIARDPADWARSFHRKPWHAAPVVRARSFPRFIREEWIAGDVDGVRFVERRHERHPISGQRFANIWALRAAKLRAWCAFIPSDRRVCVNYEQAARDPQAFLAALAFRFDWRLTAHYHPVSTYKGLATSDYRPRTYLPLTDADLAFMATRLDPELEAQFGFTDFANVVALKPKSATSLPVVGH